MKFLLLLLACTACGREMILINHSEIPDHIIYQVISDTKEFAGVEVYLDSYTVTVYATLDEARKACNNETIGCHNQSMGKIALPWSREFEDIKWLNAVGAWTLAHEMGHAYYAQSGDKMGSDHDHTHTEWFDIFSVDSVCYKVYNKYYVEVLE